MTYLDTLVRETKERRKRLGLAVEQKPVVLPVRRARPAPVDEAPTLSSNTIIYAVLDATGLSHEALTAKGNKHKSLKLLMARHVAMYLLRKRAKRTTYEIGRIMGLRDRTAVQRIIRGVDDDYASYEALLTAVEARLGAR